MEHPVLVIGALGNVGAEVVRELQSHKRKVRAADIDAAKLKMKFGSTAEAVHFDFSKPETYASAFEGVSSLFLMRPPQISDVKKYMFPAIDAAKKADVRHIVFLSLIGIEKARFVPHYKVETYLLEQGFQTTFLRCSFFMQNLNTTHRAEIRDRDEIFVPVGNAKTSFIDVRDIGAVAARALTDKGIAGRNYDLTGGEALDYWQAASILSQTLGREIKYRNPGVPSFLIETLRRGASFPYALVVTGLYMSTRFGVAKTVTDEVERLLGRKPTSFKQYTADYQEAWL